MDLDGLSNGVIGESADKVAASTSPCYLASSHTIHSLCLTTKAIHAMLKQIEMIRG